MGADETQPGQPPSAHERAAIVSVGDELSLGQTVNTNSRWVAERLTGVGIITVEHVTVADDEAALVGALSRLAGVVDLLIVTGGLGPTLDDLTRQALAAAMGDTLVEDAIALEQVSAWFTSRGRVMPELNKVQALRPTRATSLQNLHGTAPGLHGVIGRCDCFCLPGPPREMQPMFSAQVAPRLRPPPGRTVATRVLHTVGIGESDLATRLGAMMKRQGDEGVLVGTTASGGIVSVRLRYEGPLAPYDADHLLEKHMREVRVRAGAYVFGTGEDTLAGVVVKLLRERGERVGAVESCTGGLLSGMLTDVAGSSQVFAGGLITYSNALKQSLAGVDASLFGPEGPGAVSRECALAMATGGLEKLGVEHCLAITGIAGPGGAVPAFGTRPGKPVGTVYIARASRQAGAGRVSTDVRHFTMAGDRASVRDWSAKSALAMLRLHLAGAEELKLLRQAD
ncbi:MAG TPA: CinA family nicotinamide mononucleotide deamidase-related protein [Phycisphaerales bacterium]|nr:CinA family nicotinamide mononucleotide deamidase-related protein [Phycisphaerales bacterium]